MSVVAGTNAVASLGALLGGLPMGIEEFTVMPGPKGDSQAVAVALGDMTAIPADAYVVPHWQGAASFDGVGEAIVNSGALSGLESYEQYLEKLPKRENGEPKQKWCDVKFTDSGGGLSTYLANVVTIGSSDADTEKAIIAKATMRVLAKLQGCNRNSVVFPAMGTGDFGRLTDMVSAQAILGAIEMFREGYPDKINPSMVTVAIYNRRDAYEAWVRMLEMGPLSVEGYWVASKITPRGFDERRAAQGIAAAIRHLISDGSRKVEESDEN